MKVIRICIFSLVVTSIMFFYYSSSLLSDGGQLIFYMESLSSSNPNIRSEAALAIGKMGSDTRETVPILIDALGDKNSKVKENVIKALGNIGPEAQGAVPVLIEMLGGKGKTRNRRNNDSGVGGMTTRRRATEVRATEIRDWKLTAASA